LNLRNCELSLLSSVLPAIGGAPKIFLWGSSFGGVESGHDI